MQQLRIGRMTSSIVLRTLVIAASYTIFYFLTYIFAALTYSAFADMPADRSRSFSWLYFGFFFTLIPYLGTLSMAMAEVNRERLFSLKQRLVLLQTFVVTQAVDKLGIAVLATMMAQGFPWYGQEFPQSGYGLLCEELPFYCSGYVKPYIAGNTIFSVILFMAVFLGYRWLYSGKRQALQR
ncbi:hypothetical protein FHS18_001778 [Paenibacillus phyllosphaerae]|uniref:Uncharacterized protein n=1 Tax=Paenibacillus phyllosphaerae TaxID=274593 RepID=A0A7W5AVU5_9BACL|nr:hypothetical protein [Paenibacillus phyllosphaerae]MBB3109715.1 hypothetical protein [Paenibacillus phyllosphaerae]